MILHIDMDAFFASVEQLDRPELRGKCVVVGGGSKRGVVAAASYEARKFGIHSAMPGFQVRQKCPQAIFVTPRMDRYKAVSRKIMQILRDYSPLVEPVSIDEAYLDAAGCESLQGPAETIGKTLKQRIFSETGLTCSVGIAPNKFLAKIASDMDKPDGFTIVPAENVDEFIQQLPIGKVPGVGKILKKTLERMEIETLGDVRRYSEKQLVEKLGKFGYRLRSLSRGIDKTPVQPDRQHKSISSEITLRNDSRDKRELHRHMLRQSENVGRQLRGSRVKAKTVTLKIKHSDFRSVTRQQSLQTAADTTEIIYRTAVALLESYGLRRAVRLIGIGASGLVPADTPEQMKMFDADEDRKEWKKVETTVDEIQEKFGKTSIRRASAQESKSAGNSARTSSIIRAGDREPP